MANKRYALTKDLLRDAREKHDTGEECQFAMDNPRGLSVRVRGGEVAYYVQARTRVRGVKSTVVKRRLGAVGDFTFTQVKKIATEAIFAIKNGRDPEADRFAPPEALKNDGKVGAGDMFDRYANEAGLSPKTRRSWKARVLALMAFVGHDDLARLTTKDVLNWKDKLLKKKPEGNQLDPKTVRNGYLAAVKATLNYGVQQLDLSTNVAKGVSVRVKKKKKQREKGFEKQEALAILKATLAPPPRAMSVEHAAARRWVPWICAYTGARVNEVTQLLPSDFKAVKGIHVIRIDADASKTGDYRQVPLHDDLIGQGLLDYVASRGKRPLFYDPGRSRGGRDAGKHFRKTGERLAEWIRSDEVGVTDENVAPNHGWRHRFSSLARHVDMHVDVQNIIQGHVGEKTASDYGDAWIETAYREMMKIPRYVLDLPCP
jgi:integrase